MFLEKEGEQSYRRKATADSPKDSYVVQGGNRRYEVKCDNDTVVPLLRGREWLTRTDIGIAHNALALPAVIVTHVPSTTALAYCAMHSGAATLRAAQAENAR